MKHCRLSRNVCNITSLTDLYLRWKVYMDERSRDNLFNSLGSLRTVTRADLDQYNMLQKF